jgi:co-chaperonin GroES (HSP10)
VAIPALNDCKPGIRATGFNLVVAVEPADEKKGNILVPDSVREKETLVQTRGRIVSISPVAFDFANFDGDAPKLGDAVIFAKLAGIRTTLADGKEGRIIADKDVAAIIEEDCDQSLRWRPGEYRVVEKVG